jgi:hypothetical protein
VRGAVAVRGLELVAHVSARFTAKIVEEFSSENDALLPHLVKRSHLGIE